MGFMDRLGYDNWNLRMEKKKSSKAKKDGVHLSLCHFEIETKKEIKFGSGYGYTAKEAKVRCSFMALARLESMKGEWERFARQRNSRNVYHKYSFLFTGPYPSFKQAVSNLPQQ